MSTKHEAALEYAELGYKVFPLVAGKKIPLKGSSSFYDATTDEEQIDKWWGENPNYNIGLATEGLLVFDIDGAGNPLLADAKYVDQLLDLAGVPMAQTPSGGRHYFFKQPPTGDFRNTASVFAPGVDTRADCGLAVLAPSANGNGECYKWVEPLDVPRDQLPLPPQWIFDGLAEGKKKKDEEGRANRKAGEPAGPIPEGKRDDTLFRIAGGLRGIMGLDEPEIAGALLAINDARCKPPLLEKQVRQKAANVCNNYPKGPAAGFIYDGPPPPPVAGYDKPFPVRLLRPPGFLSDVIEYNLAGAPRKQPVLALGGALALLSVLTGRKIQDQGGLRTNLYILNVGGSGSGKDHSRKVNKDLLGEAGAGELVGAEGTASASGVISEVQKKNSVLLQWDEIGRFLKAIGHKNAGAHLTEVPTVLMKLYSSADTTFYGNAYADSKKNIVINQPHAVLLGTTVPESLYEGVTASSVTDGFLSRLMIFESEEEAPDYKRDVDISQPQQLPDTAPMISFIKYWQQFGSNNNLADINPKPQIVPASPGAMMVWFRYQDACLAKERNKDDPYRALWSRAVEKGKKLALLHACSRAAPGEPLEVTEVDAQWGLDVSHHLTHRMAEIGRQWISDSGHEKLCKKVMRWIKDRGGVPCSTRDISRGPMSANDLQGRDKVINHLLEKGDLERFEEKKSNGVGTKTLFRVPQGNLQSLLSGGKNGAP